MVHDQDAVNEFMDMQYGPRDNRYNLRERRYRDYGCMNNQVEQSINSNSSIFTQYSLKKGLKHLAMMVQTP